MCLAACAVVAAAAAALLLPAASGVAVDIAAGGRALRAHAGLLEQQAGAAFYSGRLERLPADDNQTIYNAWKQKEEMVGTGYSGGVTVKSHASYAKDWGEDQAKAFPAIVNRTVRTSRGISVVNSDKECYIVFRESNDALDWLRNLQLGKEKIKSMKDGRVIGEGYKGFVVVVNAMSGYLFKTITEDCIKASVSRYNIVGYSRGGGLAAIFAVMLLADNIVEKAKLTMTTFGSPRSLSSDSAKYVNSASFPNYRLVNRDDPVPKMPPSLVSALRDAPLRR